MQLKSLNIRRRESYEVEKGYTGELTTTSPSNEVKIRLSNEACCQILIVAGVGIKEAAAETAAFLSSEASLVAGGHLLEVQA